jgi:hypothetical protein
LTSKFYFSFLFEKKERGLCYDRSHCLDSEATYGRKVSE